MSSRVVLLLVAGMGTMAGGTVARVLLRRSAICAVVRGMLEKAGHTVSSLPTDVMVLPVLAREPSRS
jgi:hypothetical protein